MKIELVTLSFLATGGATLLVLGCALANYNWWPIFVVIFYVLSPLPILISRRCISDSYMSDPYSGRCVELSAFLTSILVISAYALPIVMANSPIGAPIIKWSSAAFIFAGNTVIFTTIYIFVRLLLAEENLGGW
ncbi:unnamed protein product [Brachionus calyciflorus]|uniref:Leptin receptor n=1 Tax=Brachionus calyciflorus TaxID=104777 RepID=A0A813MDB8_9BILA|nr:unnamed protein product [Brachionus calyciflorus]